MDTLHKKGNNHFIDYHVNGRRICRNVGKSKKIAELALKDLEVKIARNELGFERRDCLRQKLISEFESYCKTNFAPNTRKRYGAIINNFERFLLKEYPHLEKYLISSLRFLRT